MAWYSPLEDKIIDAVPDSLAYWHERGHQELQHRFKYYYRLSQWATMLNLLVLGYLALDDLFSARLALLALICLDYWDEIFSWGYAIYQKGAALRQKDHKNIVKKN